MSQWYVGSHKLSFIPLSKRPSIMFRIRQTRLRVAMLSACLAIVVTGCETPRPDNFRSPFSEGQSLTVHSGRQFGSRYVRVVRTHQSAWNDRLAGGSEMYPARIAFMQKHVAEEAARVCGEMGFKLTGEPSLEMTDRSNNVFASQQTQNSVLAASGGGALPALMLELLAAANSPAEGLPVSLEQIFACNDEIGKGGELKKRP
tara:strand:+ start:350 stop:955 length:606 start_codon:yes stop_codon:yes gene_type:complete